MDNGGSESGLNSSPIQPQTTSQWAKAFLIISVFAVCVMSRWSVLPFQELIKRDLHLSDVQLSLIEGLPTSLSILLFAIPFGRVVDRVNRVRLLAGIVFFIGLGELLTALSTTLVTLFAARIMSGLTPVGGIAAISILADLVVPERRGRAFVAFSVCGFLGYAAAFAVGGWLLSLADLLGYGGNWRAVHLVFAVIQSLVFVPLLLTGEPMRQGTGGEAGTQTQGLIEGLWNMRLFLIPFYIASAAVAMAFSGGGAWVVSILHRQYGLQPSAFGSWMAVIIFGGGILGSSMAGFAAERGQRPGVPGGVLIGGIVASLVLIPAGMFALSDNLIVFGIMYGLVVMCGSAGEVLVSVAIGILVPNRMRGVCLGINSVLYATLALALAPTLVAWTSTAICSQQCIGVANSIISTSLGVIAFVSFVLAARQVKHHSASRVI